MTKWYIHFCDAKLLHIPYIFAHAKYVLKHVFETIKHISLKINRLHVSFLISKPFEHSYILDIENYNKKTSNRSSACSTLSFHSV